MHYIFKDFKPSYLEELALKYPDKSVIIKIFKKDIEEARKKLNKKSLTHFHKEYWIMRGWTESEALEKIEEVKRKIKKPEFTAFQKDYWISKGYSEEKAKQKVSEIQKSNSQKSHKKRKEHPENYKKIISPMTIEFWIRKGYSEEEAHIQAKSQRSINKEYWTKKGYSEEEAIEKVKEVQSKNAKKWAKKRKEHPENYFFDNQLKYWLKMGYPEDEAKQKLKDRQTTFSLKKCIEKYGEEKGLERWKQRQSKWLNSYKKNNYSKISQVLFKQLYERIKNDFKDIYFATKENNGKNNEFRLHLIEQIILPDFFIKDINKIIEFDGIYWHKRNPINKTRESKRDKLIINNGYKVMHVREDDFCDDPQNIIVKCLNFIYE